MSECNFKCACVHVGGCAFSSLSECIRAYDYIFAIILNTHAHTHARTRIYPYLPIGLVEYAHLFSSFVPRRSGKKLFWSLDSNHTLHHITRLTVTAID